jgi:hypothetical protein
MKLDIIASVRKYSPSVRQSSPLPLMTPASRSPSAVWMKAAPPESPLQGTIVPPVKKA